MEDTQNKKQSDKRAKSANTSRGNRYYRNKRPRRPRAPAPVDKKLTPPESEETIVDANLLGGSDKDTTNSTGSAFESIELIETDAPDDEPGMPDPENIDADLSPAAPEDEADLVDVVGVRFKHAGKVYYFSPGETNVKRGDFVIVETARGPEYGEAWMPARRVPQKEIVLPLRPIIRVADLEDFEHNEQNRKREKEAFAICLEKIARHGLDMKLVEAKYTFDNSKLLFYFTSAGRVDFRELVKDLASVFRTRIELRQIGIRDEAKLLGGIGACGRSLCCTSFLSDFMQVSIRMAKEQNLSLNSNKISGSCGRLMCCLRYEYDTYVEEIRQTPPVKSVVRTADGDGVVIETAPLAATVKVRLTGKPDNLIKVYNRDDVKVLSRPLPGERDRYSGKGKNAPKER